MPLRCPNCYTELNQTTYRCVQGHQFSVDDGVLTLLNDQFKSRLNQFTNRLHGLRDQEGIAVINTVDTAAFNNFPFTKPEANHHEWQVRRYDLALILKLLRGRGSLHALDIGAWNGWLSHQLTRHGHRVTAVDFFIDEFNGLRAKKFYDTKWQAIQMDLTDFSVLDQTYDLIILNHGLHFFSDPVAQVAAAKEKLAKDGLLILIGGQFFLYQSHRQRYIHALQQRYRDQYGFDLFLNPTKGYLSLAEIQRLRKLNIRLRIYPGIWGILRSGKAMVTPSESLYFYGVYENS